MVTRLRLLAAALLIVVAVGLAACGSDSMHSAMGHDEGDMTGSGMTHDADHMGTESGMTHDADQMGTGRTADVMFTQEMIPHHQQAVDMANLALDPAHQASAEVQDLATRIKTAQAAEIADMNAWLDEWGADPANGHMDHDGSGMGMMSAAQMTALENAKGAEFDRLWLEGMITHHEGALMMASHVADRGEDPRVQKLSTAIDSSQTAEIAEMRKLLGQ